MFNGVAVQYILDGVGGVRVVPVGGALVAVLGTQ